MDKPLDPDALVRELRRLPPEERRRIAVELLRDLEPSGGEPPELLEELRRRAEYAVAHPEENVSFDVLRAQLRDLRRRPR